MKSTESAAHAPSATAERTPRRSQTYSVRNSEALEKAFGKVQPGDRVELADGSYRTANGRPFKLANSGTPDQHITVTGGPDAILVGGKKHDTLVVDASYIDFSGFSVHGGKRSIMTHNADFNTWTGMDVGKSQAEAFHLRDNSSDNLIEGCTVHDAGLDPGSKGIGEGIYIGSSIKNWDTNESTGYRKRPDRSDRNRIVGNTLYNTTAECVDVKEGTTGTLLQGNVLDGNQVSGVNGAESQVALKGNDATATQNRYVDSSKRNQKLEGTVLVKSVKGADGWGKNNTTAGEATQSTAGTRPRPAGTTSPAPEVGASWTAAAAAMACSIVDRDGNTQARLKKGEAVRVREGSAQKMEIEGVTQKWWRAMPAEDLGRGTERKGWLPGKALARAPAETGGPSSPRPAPSGGLSTDTKFPPGIVEALAKVTGMDSEQWDNALDLFAKAEQDQEKGWTQNPNSFYGSCELLDYDKSKRGFTIGAFGATTGGTESGDAERLFKEAGIDPAKDLGYPDKKKFIANVNKLGDNPAWQAASWRWFIKEYVEPTMAALKTRGFTSALTVAAVTDCSFNQGNDMDQGTAWVLKQVGNAKDEETFLHAFLDARDKVVDVSKYDFNSKGNGKQRVQMYRRLLDQGHLNLKDCKGEVRDATKWTMN